MVLKFQVVESLKMVKYCFPGVSVVRNVPANAGDGRFNPWIQKIPWKSKWPPTPVVLPRNIPRTEEPGMLQSMGSQMRHNLAWTEEPGGLQSMGSDTTLL